MMSKWGMLTLLLVPLLLFELGAVTEAICFADMTPDHNLLVGSTLVINCTLPNKEYAFKGVNYFVNSSNIRFKFKQRQIDKEFIEIVDDFTATLTLPNATIHNSGPYYCFLEAPKAPNLLLGCLNNVSVGHVPAAAENFSCISFHYKNLTCTWVRPYNPVKTTYDLFIYPYGSMGYNIRQGCGDKLSESSCQWRMNTSPPYRKSSDVLSFILIANNTLGSNTQEMEFSHYARVLAGAPNDFKLVNVAKHGLAVTWNPPDGMNIPDDFRPGVLYQLNWGTGGNDQIIDLKQLHYNLTGLIPNTRYSLRLRCKSSYATDPAMWSPYSAILVTTLPDVPYLSPKMSPEVFEVLKVGGTQSIILYWKPLLKHDQNGDDFYYIAWNNELGSDVVLNSINTTSTHVEFLNLSLDSSYEFHVMAANCNGNSSNKETIIIGSRQMRPPAPKSLTVIARGNGSYDISWHEPLGLTSTLQGYTIVWCQSFKPRPYLCDGPIEWQHLRPAERSTQLNLRDDHLYNYQFGLSLMDEIGSSGLIWASCLVPTNGVLPKLQDITLEPKNATSLRVKWRMECEAQKKLIKAYKVAYCKTFGNNKDCLEKPSTIVLTNLTSLVFYLSHLKPYTYYQVKVSPQSETGQTQDSDPLWERTLSAAPSDPPQDISVHVTGADSMHVSWNPPEEPNGIISHYEVIYGPSHLMVKDKLTADLHGLQYYTNYSIQVVACVEKACSPPSLPQSYFSGIGVPGIMDAPRVEILNVTSWKIKVSWLPPSVGNGPIDQYILEFRGDNSTTINSTIPGSNVSTTMEVDCHSMGSNDKYSFRIRAINLVKEEEVSGPWSETTITSLCYTTRHGLTTWAIVLIVLSFLLVFALTVSISTYINKFSNEKLNPIETSIELPNNLEENAVVLKFMSYFKNSKSNNNHNQNTDTDGDNKERHESGTSHHSTEKLLNVRPENIEMIPTSSPLNITNDTLVNTVSIISTKDNEVSEVLNNKFADFEPCHDKGEIDQNIQNYAKVSQDEGYQPWCVLNPNLIHCIIDPTLKLPENNPQDAVESIIRKDSDFEPQANKIIADKSPEYISIQLQPHNDKFALDSTGNLIPNSSPINNYVPFIPFKPNLADSQESVRATECELLLHTEENQEPPNGEQCNKKGAILSPSYIVSSLLNPPLPSSVESSSNNNNNVVKPVVWL